MAKRYEKSSGGVVYRKNGNKIEILLLRWTNSRQEEEYVLPKGKIEEGEIAKETAVREISEETGLKEKDLEIIKFMTKLSYTFTAGHLQDNPLIEKDVYLFLVKYNGNETPKVRTEERFTGYKWFSLDEIKNLEIKFDIVSLVNKNKVYFI
ncbi:NUDIX domain-containing protein [Candidatus Gracilibacteria bacterium]|nr:NUDIX domain-containing protein [Candidatus Gracilibacteria bacterium]NUJ98472.1 NUDIX domain-containing protein [Candidatus Gracilibacteria bacterium]